MISGRTFNLACNFHATRDGAESANIESVMAAQRNPHPSQQALAQPPQPPFEPVRVTKSAAPPTATQGTARQSNASWDEPACQLIPKSSLESILGFQYGDPKIVPVDENSVPFGSLGIIALSSCQYATVAEHKSGVTLTVWYTKNLDPGIAKDYFFHYLQERLTGRDDVTVPGFPYPAVFRNAPRGTYFFKGGPNGLTILMVDSYVMPQDSTNGEEVHVARAKEIALKILGLPQPPKSLAASPPTAPAGIVTKPKVYWETYYRTDLIRQVFEGHFVASFDSAQQFKMLFTTYVEMFSAHCSAYLPARHEAFTITSQQTGQTSTVEVDPRFAPKYQQYFESLIRTAGQSPADALAIASGRVDASDYFAPGTDVMKFFQSETCQSAAMRQLGENLLRTAGN
jgi:hypothetical protein